MTGTVQRFDVQRGFGFIGPDEGGKDVFVHYSQVEATEGETFRVLYENDVVSFDVEQNEKGPRAINCRVLQRA